MVQGVAVVLGIVVLGIPGFGSGRTLVPFLARQWELAEVVARAHGRTAPHGGPVRVPLRCTAAGKRGLAGRACRRAARARRAHRGGRPLALIPFVFAARPAASQACCCSPCSTLRCTSGPSVGACRWTSISATSGGTTRMRGGRRLDIASGDRLRRGAARAAPARRGRCRGASGPSRWSRRAHNLRS